MTLSELLQRELEAAGSMTALAAKTGTAHTALQAIIDGTTTVPKLETLVRFSQAFNLPLWRVVEMAGFDLGLDRGSATQAQRLASLLNDHPEFGPIVDDLTAMNPDDFEGMLRHLEGLVIAYQRRQGTSQSRSQ
jgi:hypothetical protein